MVHDGDGIKIRVGPTDSMVTYHNSRLCQILFDELFLKVDGVSANDRLFVVGRGEKNGGDEIPKTFSYTRASLHQERSTCFQSLGHRCGHGLLLRPIFKSLRLRKRTRWRENLSNLRFEIAASGIRFKVCYHLVR